MFEAVREFAAAYSVLLWLVVATAVVIVALSQWRVRFWLMDFWMRFPLIGTIARLSKDATRGNNGWMRSEQRLCASYKEYIGEPLNATKFDNRTEYLRKATDLGSTPTPFGVWILLVVLVIAEGLGFSYLLGSWMAREGSASTHALLMLAIVFVLCVLLVWVTHSAGHQYRRTSLLISCFKRYKEVGGREYSTSVIKLDSPQSVDDGEPDYKQTLNRVAKNSHDRGGWVWVATAVVSIVVIAVVSTYMRMSNLDAELGREATLEQSTSAANPFALPADVAAPQKAADDKAKADVTSAVKQEGMAAFVMLGFIFVVTQIVGIGAGYKYGFVGLESKAAYRATWGYSTYDDYWAHFQPVYDLANARLKDLQQRLESDSHTKLALSKTFDDYFAEENARKIAARDSHDASGNTKYLAPASMAMAAVVPFPAAVTIDAAKAELSRLTDVDAKNAYFRKLPDSLKEELRPWIKQLQEEEKARKAAEEAREDNPFSEV